MINNQTYSLGDNRKSSSNRSIRMFALIIPAIITLCSCGGLQLRTNSSVYDGTIVTTHIDDLDMAHTPKGMPSQIIRHKGHTLSYNNNWRLANWVGYELTREETDGHVERTDWFEEDPQVQGVRVRHSDYTNSGFDRGHMAPAGDMKWNKEAMVASFYMSNICPQVHALNAGVWNTLENRARSWATQDSAIIIVSGPIVPAQHMTIGRNRVAVPTHFYKIIASPYGHSPRGIAFVMPNEATDAPLYTYTVSIDSVEKLTGIDFLYNLPDSLENFIENNIDLSSWQL